MVFEGRKSLLKETLISNIFQEDYGDAWIQPDVDEFIQKKHEQSELLEFVEKESETDGENFLFLRNFCLSVFPCGCHHPIRMNSATILQRKTYV